MLKGGFCLNWANCQCLVLGPGVSGKAAALLLKYLGAKVYLLGKGEPSSWQDFAELSLALGVNNLLSQEDPKVAQLFKTTKFCILSPGIPRDLPLLSQSGLSAHSIINEIELAYLIMPMKLLGLTGTNGKTTTVTLLGNILKARYPKVFVGGNIGIPLCQAVLQALKSGSKIERALLELSSFQLESLFQTRFEAGAILNITPSHGERYKDFTPYRDAKLKLASLLLPVSNAEKNLFLPKEFSRFLTSQAGVMELEETESWLKTMEKNLGLNLNLKIPGQHNHFNALVAAMLAKFWQADKELIETETAAFCGVSHRLESVTNSWGIEIYNDSKSTNWQSTLTALKAMDEKETLGLILGGMPRGGNEDLPDTETLSLLKQRKLVIATFGKVSQSLEKYLTEKGLDAHCFSDLAGAVNFLRDNNKVKTLLFSPAYPSFDHYKSYADRGVHFKQLVLAPSAN